MQYVPGFSNIEIPRPSVFGQFIPGGIINNDGSANWLQVPPSQMPWGIPVADQPSIVRFTAESTSHMKTNDFGSFAQSKRKLDEEEEIFPTKQHITEEKMAAHFNQLHISPEYTSHQQEEPKEDKTQHLKRLVLCEELRKLKHEPILPSSLLSHMEKPTMALVLWQPPAGTINQALRAATAREEDNNNTSVVDLNSMSDAGYSSSQEDALMDL
ncbi:hypothetical protein L9F63_009584 [Diploptera punctata]|uniref:Uncharacterized protein n=1 Tax=Diploptera punctata TaxID=6984 RepID=A0AAD8AJ32_DIPPU|nr:hypothetical protein L9F63_009584 [Diploptera punctata]